MRPHPFDLPIGNPLARFVLEKLTRLRDLRALYESRLAPGESAVDCTERLLEVVLRNMATAIEVENPGALDAIPRSGPLIVVANHPLGGLEGMLLTQLLLSIRPDLKVLTNQLLLRIPEFEDVFIGVDVLNADARRANGKGVRALSKHLGAGGAALVFPAGTVSTVRLPALRIADPAWNELVGALALRHRATCVPIHVGGRNSFGFYLAGMVSKRLRTLLLGRAMLAKRGTRVRARIGEPIPGADIAQLADAQAATSFLRLCCDLLGVGKVAVSGSRAAASRPIRADVAAAALHEQLQALARYQVQGHGDFAVYCAPFDALGCVMEQIAIARERTFRSVEEGTGQAIDQDRFDPHYWHLWVWDTRNQCIAGAYRLAKVDQLLDHSGLRNIYSRSLYDYDATFIRHLGKSLEVGRSFITPEYQRHPRVLDLLWKGLGAFIVDNPGYHTLFGCVSISQQYSQLGRAILAEVFLYHYGAEASVRQRVRPSAPLRARERPWSAEAIAALRNIPLINKILGRIDGRSIPTLIHHYLSLNGKFISFTVNHGFNQSLDGLIVVDLRTAPARYIDRYLGSEGSAQFEQLHGLQRHVA